MGILGTVGKGLAGAAVGAGATLRYGGMIPNLLGSLGGPEQQTGGVDLGSAGGAFMPQSGGGSGTNVAPGRTVVVSAPTPAPDPSLKVIVGLVAQALTSLSKIDSTINAQRSEQAAAAASSAKQLREATLEGGGKAELAASPQMGGGRVGGTGILGALGTAAGAGAVYNYMTGDKKKPGSADAAAGSDGTPAPGPGDAVAPDGSIRGGLEGILNKGKDIYDDIMGGGSNDVSKGGAIFDPLKGKGSGRNQAGLGSPRAGGRSHEGIDLFVPIGTPVYAVADGKLYYSYRQSQDGGSAGFGLAVCIDHGGGWVTKYAHFSKLVFNRRPGANGPRITRGQLIGYTGDTGNAKGTLPHLHFEVRYKDVAQEASQYLTGQKTIPGAKVADNNQKPIRDSAPTPSSSDDVKLAQNDAAPVEAPSATSMTPRVMNASYTPSEQGSNAFGSGGATDPSRYNNLGPDGLPDEQSTLKPEYTQLGASLGMVGASAPMAQNALYRSTAPAPTPRTVPAPSPMELKPPANDNIQSWWSYLKQEFKKAGSLKNGKFAKAVEAAAKKLAVRYPTVAKGLRNAVKNPKALAAIGAALAVGLGVDWLTSYFRETFPEEVPLKPSRPAPVTPAPAPVTPTPKPDAKPAPVPDTRTVPVPGTQLETVPATGTGTGPTPGAQPAPATGIVPVDPVDPTSVTPPVNPFIIPLVPVPKGFKKPKPVKAPGDLERIYGDRPGLTFKDREYDATRATGVSRGSGQLGLGRSEAQTGVIGDPLLLPPTPSFTPDRRASAIDSMSREREKSSKNPPRFDSGTPDAYTPPAKTQAARDQYDAANGGTGASPSSVPNPSAYDVVKEYQVYFLNPSAVMSIA
jgi:murein DD-endopeptidase MepM/ murein hydrolase activator NlpD